MMKFLKITGLKGAPTMIFAILDQSSTRRVLKSILKMVASKRMQKLLIEEYIGIRVKLEWKSINRNRGKKTKKRLNSFNNDPETRQIYKLFSKSEKES